MAIAQSKDDSAEKLTFECEAVASHGSVMGVNGGMLGWKKCTARTSRQQGVLGFQT